ncbi:MAG: lamin tail domain-containing protein, partial [Candidatus Magasanikbacteria bacterium]|nr:lamin tail domain-containing protein [Candidatus Magasanikbacteria bacterium]
IKINEFACAPEGDENEWVEFFNNNTSSVDLSGGYLCDEQGISSTVSSCKIINGIIEPFSWFFFDLDTRRLLNNDKDTVVLRNLNGEEIDKIYYEGSLTPKVNQSLARKTDGEDSDSDGDWAITTSITKNSTNTITTPVTPVSSGGGSNNTVIQEEEELVFYNTSDKIILNEIYPDPIGSDTLDEFIEIKNIGTEIVDLTGWSIADKVKKYVLSGNLFPDQFAVYKREQTGISLNNSTSEEVKLADPSGKLIESVSYDFAPEGQSYAKTASGTWAWTTEISLGLENKVAIVDNVGITVNIIYPNNAEIGEVVIFDASESFDSNGGQLNFLWNFSDNLVLFGEEVSKVFTTSGLFSVKLTVSSTKSEPVDKTVNIKVGLGLTQTETGIIISEVFPNPDGVDKGEFIELFNTSSSSVDLADWEIKNKNGKVFKILTGTKIEPGAFLIFYQNVTKITLGNGSEKLSLTDKNGDIVDLVKYEKAPSGQSYSFFEGNWFWADEANPGRLVMDQEINKTEKVSLTSVSPKKTYQIKSLADTRESEVKDLVITQGVVAVLPNIFSTQYIYVIDGGVGLQVYNFKKDWPELKIGDKVKITGEISQASGVKRIKTKTKNDIVKIGFATTTPLEIKTLDILEETSLGALVKVSGEITAIKTSVIYLDDGNNEATIYLKKNAMIDRKKYKVGQTIEVTGILEAGTSGLQIWPRQNEDLFLLTETTLNEEITLQTENNSKETASNYLFATLGGFSALFLGFFFKNKGVIIKGAIALAGKLIKRG